METVTRMATLGAIAFRRQAKGPMLEIASVAISREAGVYRG